MQYNYYGLFTVWHYLHFHPYRRDCLGTLSGFLTEVCLGGLGAVFLGLYIWKVFCTYYSNYNKSKLILLYLKPFLLQSRPKNIPKITNTQHQ